VNRQAGSEGGADPPRRTFYVGDRYEARTGHGCDAVTEMLPGFMEGIPTNQCTRHLRGRIHITGGWRRAKLCEWRERRASWQVGESQSWLALRQPADPDDDIFLECAQAARAAYLVTDNTKQFPATWRETRIVAARQFLEIIASEPEQQRRRDND